MSFGSRIGVLLAGSLLACAATWGAGSPDRSLPAKIAPFFSPPPELAEEFGSYRSPLRFDDGRLVKTAAEWKQRRQEILRAWQAEIGAWPPLITKPKIEYLDKERRESFTQQKVRVETWPDRTGDGYLLIPDGAGPFPAVLVVFYEPETGIGARPGGSEYALQLARRGFVALSLGTPSLPAPKESGLQPLSALAYAAANCGTALASLPQVDPKRIGVIGHSYGGKWAMFASCLDERFACAVWSDPGVVFDETRANVNYWEPWYLGWEAGKERKPGIPTAENPRTGAYRRLVEAGHDLVELHALMAPRPFLVSGGSEDTLERWKALNHTRAVNRLLGHSDRVALTTRPNHPPTPEANAQVYGFFEHFLK